ncbi:MAG: D-alanyl-D-alanine carboxypeptidase [Ruminococcaceae bacterium]|nr:D-alanyl-D-alanine carboxypeptidase [Oscillospiraceae bacterium]
MKTKRIRASLAPFLLAFLLLLTSFPVMAADQTASASLDIDCVSAILIEQSTGKVLFEKDADIPLPPASVTKIMTLLLIMEALDNGQFALTDTVQTSENAASMGGSQIFLEPGETMSADDMLKSIVVASANDAAVAMAEFICGSVEAFVEKMNTRAAELGMANTHFVNVTGLDDGIDNHLTSARDIALMSRELLTHERIFNYTTLWMDTVRNGQFGLTNTNRLIRFYNGANGLKTGSTAKAKFCISATAERNGMQLIAVIMAAPSRDIRNECAKKLLDYGFANYTRVHFDAADCGTVRVKGGVQDNIAVRSESFDAIIDKSGKGDIEQIVTLEESAAAPIQAGQKLGSIRYLRNGVEIGSSDILASESVDNITYFGLLLRLLEHYLLI